MRKLILIASAGLALVVITAVVLFVFAGGGRLKAFAVTPGPVSAARGTYEVKLLHDGRERTYYLHVPPAASRGEALALVMALHGGGGRAQQMDDLSHINDGRPDSGSKAQKEEIDDVGFIRAVIDDASSRLKVDSQRVFATGISNGAIMSNRLACEAADKIAAVALVVGTAPQGFEQSCAPGRPVPFMAFLSRNDPLVPYNGGEITALLNFIKRGRVVSADDLEAFWTRNNGCLAASTVDDLPNRRTADDSTVTRTSHGQCNAGADVVFYRFRGSGHTWPGGKQYLSPWLVGTTNRDIDATELIWEFFKAHPMP